MLGWPAERWKLTTAWLQALVDEKDLVTLKRYVPEAVAIINTGGQLKFRTTDVDIELSVKGLLGEHSSIENRTWPRWIC